MEHKVVLKGREGRISLVEGAREVAYLSFEIEDKRLIYATHTVVSPEYQGQGLAARLVALLVAWARERALLIQPVCSYIVRLAERGGELSQCLETYSEAQTLISQLSQMADPERAKGQARYFKTGKGQYGEGDIFLGVSTPQIKALLKCPQNPLNFRRRNLSRATLCELWQSPYHEARSLACYAVADWAGRCDADSIGAVYDLYLQNAEHCNNWDLVDVSAPYVIGAYWAGRDAEARRSALLDLAGSENLWVQRIAIVGTLGLIRQGLYADTFALVVEFIEHRHDLIHKAMGWMLREVGKHSGLGVLRAFLDKYAMDLPRTALRYALEHFGREERSYYMRLKTQVKQG